MNRLDILQLNKYHPPVQNWLENDDKDTWQHNRKQVGEGWYYYNADDIEYKHNSYGYRCPEFDSFKWKNKVLFMGCSHVYGKGNYLKDTIPSLYSKLSGIPTINMGVCGSGPDTIHHNTIALIEKNYIPKKVIICWPEISRQMFYNGAEINSGEKPLFLGNWVVEENHWTFSRMMHAKKRQQDAYINFVEKPEHYKTIAYLLQTSVMNAWKLAGVPVYNYYFHYGKLHVNGQLAFPFKTLPKGVDRARDCLHWGPESNKIYAEYIDKYT